jgi:hypothetical protein
VAAGALCAALAATAAERTVMLQVAVDSEEIGYEGVRAFDGNRATMWHTEWLAGVPRHPHEITLDLGEPLPLQGFVYLPREGGGNGTIGDYECYVGDDPKQLGEPVGKGRFSQPNAENRVLFPQPLTGRYLRLRAVNEVNGQPWTSIAELTLLCEGAVFKAAPPPPAEVLRLSSLTPEGLDREWQDQFEALQYELRRRERLAGLADQVCRPEALVLASDRDPLDVLLRRTEALLAHLRRQPRANPAELAESAATLAALRQAGDALPSPGAAAARRDIFAQVWRLQRRIAFANPLLRFDRLLFATHHRATYDHMCDQYYGTTARPGGSLFVLEDPFGANPVPRDVLANATVARGRLAGQRLNQGSFISPDLSYEADRIAFAYVECAGDPGHLHHTDPERGHWDAGRCFHVFTARLDGSDLAQLTDGTWNDFDPCWLPNGRLAFISERRGGYLRCGRVCPTYTLHDMAPDGTDLRALSIHETNEWHPSVTHDGRIIYTRWDYVDRFGCTAHMPWITTLDGRDSRALHGNFAPRNARPDMELDVRAIPGSHSYVATAAPHHGQAYGSLVRLDPRVPDDDAMAPVKRITPDVDFPESQGGVEAYGTAWPLDEDFFLCVYDWAVASRKRGVEANYGIYLVDTFGNRVLVYRDPQISCLGPIPVQARPQPVVPAEAGVSVARGRPFGQAVAGDGPAEATVTVMNVYAGLKPWPEGTRITALRVLQVLPMTVPSGAPPHEIGLREASSPDSVILARNVLGTVPVESDGSAHFRVPAYRELVLQAPDDRGLAVQSMRSAFYLQGGERLTCLGCHEPKSRAAVPPAAIALATRREASRLTPEVEGSYPFSYPRLVQPVLDRNCVACHQRSPDKAPVLSREPVTRNWYASYNSLAPKYGFYDYRSPLRTTPGQFGARASKLYALLSGGHHDLELPPEDLHRIALWLDCCSVFYGVYEKEGGQAQLAGEVALPTLE